VPALPRLLYVVTLAEVGGAQTYVRDLVPAMKETFDVSVAAHGDGPLRAAVEEAGAKFIPLSHLRRPIAPLQDTLGLLELVRLFRNLRPQIVHLNSAKAGILGRIAARIVGVQVCVFTAHGWTFKSTSGLTSRLYRTLDRLVRPLATAIICVSDAERRIGLAAGTCTEERTVVIPNAVPLPALTGRRGRSRSSPLRLISVGRIANQKDFATLVSAVALLPRGSVELQILGDGPLRSSIEAQITGLQLDTVVEMAGSVNDVPARLAAADAFVLSSHYEGMPIAVLEAMAAGLPVVATDLDGIREVVTPEGTRLLARPGDPHALAGAIRCLIDDSGLRARLGSENRARVEERFSLEAWRDRHGELYAALLAANVVRR
jgi:glycosyltransferase involved in cell wall biosynthesis